MNIKSNEYQVPKEDYDNVYLTNKILNKSNIELKNQIKVLENEKEGTKELKNKLMEMSKMMDNMKSTLSNYENKMQESNDVMDNLQKINSDISSENKKLKNEVEGLNGNFEFIDKTNNELKEQLDNLEGLNNKSDNDKHLLSTHLNEKDKIISELNEKYRCLNDVNSNTKKSCRDYEDILNGMKRTIDIMKKSSDDGDSEVRRTKTTITELQDNLKRKNEEFENLEIIKNSLQSEIKIRKFK